MSRAPRGSPALRCGHGRRHGVSFAPPGQGDGGRWDSPLSPCGDPAGAASRRRSGPCGRGSAAPSGGWRRHSPLPALRGCAAAPRCPDRRCLSGGTRPRARPSCGRCGGCGFAESFQTPGPAGKRRRPVVGGAAAPCCARLSPRYRPLPPQCPQPPEPFGGAGAAPRLGDRQGPPAAARPVPLGTRAPELWWQRIMHLGSALLAFH